MQEASPSRHAIVYGASGLIGWALVNELLKAYPKPGSFDTVTAVTNREIQLSKTYWPETGEPKLQLCSGIDLRGGDGATLAGSLKQKIRGVENVTHIFYLVFTSVENEIEEVKINQRMFQNVVDCHQSISPNLQFVAFPGGTRGYGIYSAGGTFTPPLREEMVNDLPHDYEATLVYPVYRRMLSEATVGRRWTWCEVCPDAIIGFTPNGSQFSLALHWAQYLSLYAYDHGIGPQGTSPGAADVAVPFPGNAAGANSLFSPVSAGTIARFMIYASLKPETCGGGRLFNIADREEPCNYGDIWIQLAARFGLVGTVPTSGDDTSHSEALGVGDVPQATSAVLPGEYISMHKGVFAEKGRDQAISAGVGQGSGQLDSVGYWLTFDRQMSLETLRSTGFSEVNDPVQGWFEAIEMFKKAGLVL